MLMVLLCITPVAYFALITLPIVLTPSCVHQEKTNVREQMPGTCRPNLFSSGNLPHTSINIDLLQLLNFL